MQGNGQLVGFDKAAPVAVLIPAPDVEFPVLNFLPGRFDLLCNGGDIS